jgi:hypothetical protein
VSKGNERGHDLPPRSVAWRWLKRATVGAALVFILPWLILAAISRRQPHERWLKESRVVSSEVIATSGLLETVALNLAGGSRVRALVRRSSGATSGAPRPRRAPAVLLLGGHETGKDAARMVPYETMVVAAIDYPYDGPLRLRNLPRDLAWIPDIWRALDRTPPAVLGMLEYLRTRSDVNADSIAVAGVSLGAPFALAAQAAAASGGETGFAAVAFLYGGARFDDLLHRNLARELPRGLSDLLAFVFVRLLAPFEPEASLALISETTPILVVAGRDDERLSAEDVDEIFSRRTEIRWIPGGHVEPDRRKILDALIQECLRWLKERRLCGAEA